MASKKTTVKKATETAVTKPVSEKKKGVVIAKRPLLYDGRVFKTGETVPFRDEKVNAWIKEGSAEVV